MRHETARERCENLWGIKLFDGKVQVVYFSEEDLRDRDGKGIQVQFTGSKEGELASGGLGSPSVVLMGKKRGFLKGGEYKAKIKGRGTGSAEGGDPQTQKNTREANMGDVEREDKLWGVLRQLRE